MSEFGLATEKRLVLMEARSIFDAPRRSMSNDLISIQYLRGIAVVLVVLHHSSFSGLEYLSIPQLGGFGVDIFFVISGFIMWHTTVATDISVVEFWRRRIIRIVPLYWLFLSALVVVTIAAPNGLKSTVVTYENAIKSFLFVPHFHAVQKIIAPILIPGWSLNYEMFFYFLFGVALLVSSRSLRVVLLGTCLFGLVLLGFVFQPTGAVAETYTSFELLKFFDGVVLAIAYRSNRLNNPTLGMILACIGLFAHCFPSEGFGRLESFLGLSATLIVAGGLALESVAQRVPIGLFHMIGNASYSIYLSHLFFLRLSELAGKHLVMLGSMETVDVMFVAFSLVFAIAGGILIYYIVERPILSLLKRPQSVLPAAG